MNSSSSPADAMAPSSHVGLQPVGMGEGAARERGIGNLQEPVGAHLLVMVRVKGAEIVREGLFRLLAPHTQLDEIRLQHGVIGREDAAVLDADRRVAVSHLIAEAAHLYLRFGMEDEHVFGDRGDHHHALLVLKENSSSFKGCPVGSFTPSSVPNQSARAGGS